MFMAAHRRLERIYLTRGSTPRWKVGGVPRVSTKFKLSVKNEQDDLGRDGQTWLARPISKARTGIGKYSFTGSADHKQD